MKFDADRPLLDREGQQIVEPIFEAGVATGETRDLTHGIVAVRAIDATQEGDKDLKAEDVRKRFMLGARIMAGGLVDLTPAEAAMIQKRVCAFGVVVAGALITALDSDAAAPAKPLS